MTDMTSEEINRMIAEWVGIASQYACHADGEVDETCVIDLNERHDCVYASNIETKEQCDLWMQRRDTPTPDYYRSNAAMDLLGVLVERGYSFKINGYVTTQFQVFIYCVTDDELPLETVSMAVHSTIPAAICTAIIELIEREGK